MVVIDSFTSKNRDHRVLEDIEAVFAGAEGESFNADTKVAVVKIFYVATRSFKHFLNFLSAASRGRDTAPPLYLFSDSLSP
jgi:hypothetical protein